MPRTIGEAFIGVRPDVSRTGQELRRELSPQLSRAGREQGRQYGQSFNAGAGGALRSFGGTARTALAGVTAAVTGAAGAGIAVFALKTAASLEQAQIGFETLLGSSRKAKTFLTDLKSFAAKTPFELPGLIDSSRTLLGVGVNAKQVIPILTAFGDAAGAVGVGQDAFQRIMLATSQAISAGKFQAGDLNQIMTNGIPIYKLLSEAMGKPTTEIKKLASEGKLLTKDVLPLLQKQMEKDYGGAMAKQSKTLAGVWSTLTDTVAIGLSDVIQPLVPIFAAALPKAAAALQGGLKIVGLGFKAMFAAFREGDVTSDGFVGVMERIGVAARQVFGFIKTGVIPTLRSMAGFMSRNRDVIIPLVAALGAAVITIKAITIATRVWAAAQVLLDAAMAANPIGIVVVAIAALVTALIVAYKNSDRFRNIVQGAWRGIQAAVSFAWNNVIKPAVTALVWYFQHVIAPVALWLWNNVIKPAFTGISYAVKAAWVVIQAIFAAWKLYLVNVLFPVLRFLWNNVVKPVFAALGAAISVAWNKVIKPVFVALGGFIRDKVAPAFRAGVAAIAAAWNGIKAAASAPVRFVVDTVINKGIIGAINWVASKVGVKDRIPPIRWDSGVGSGVGGAAATAARRIAGAGDGPGVGDGIGSLLAGPGKWLSNRVGLGRIGSRFGANPFTHALTGAAGKAKDFALTKIQTLITELFGAGGGSVGAGGLRGGILGVLAALRGQFGNVPIISGFRPRARTLSGRRSYHALGRAIDIAPVYAWASFLAGTFGGRLRELITPWQEFNRLNGRPHTYTGAIWNQHNFAGGNAHIHAAMDRGGYLMPGWNGPIYNGTGRPEPVIPADRLGGGEVHFHFHGPVASKRAAQDMVLEAYNALVQSRRIPAGARR